MSGQDHTPLVEFRCPTVNCGRLLLKVSKLEGVNVEVRCRNCKQTIRAELSSIKEDNRG